MDEEEDEEEEERKNREEKGNEKEKIEDKEESPRVVPKATKREAAVSLTALSTPNKQKRKRES